MCMVDYAMSKHSKTSQVTRTVIAASRQIIVDEDLQRIAIVISPPVTGYTMYSFNEGDGSTIGIRHASDMPPLILTLKDHGSLVTKKIFGQHSAATESVTYWSTSLDVPIDKYVETWKRTIEG